MLRAIAYIRRVDDEWFHELNEVLNKIDSDLRERRNRFTHDTWFRLKGLSHRRRKYAKIKRPQAFALEIATEEKVLVKMAEVWSLGQEILEAQIEIARLTISFQDVKSEFNTRLEEKFDPQVIDKIWQAVSESNENILKTKSSRPTPHRRNRKTHQKKMR